MLHSQRKKMYFRSCNIALVLIYFWSIQNPHSALTGSNTATNKAHVDFFIVPHWKHFPWLQSKQALQLFFGFIRETALKTPKSTCSQWAGQYWSKQQQINTRYFLWKQLLHANMKKNKPCQRGKELKLTTTQQLHHQPEFVLHHKRCIIRHNVGMVALTHRLDLFLFIRKQTQTHNITSQDHARSRYSTTAVTCR